VICLVGCALAFTWGAEYRARYESLDPSNYGIGAAGQTYSAFGERFLVSGDLRSQNSLRLFVQLSAATAPGREPVERGFDKSALDIAQAFLELRLPGLDESTLRIGRQEFDSFGNRLVATREAANLRRAFDEVQLNAHSGKLQIRVWAARPVVNRAGAFDDRGDKTERFWGGIVYGDTLPALGGLSAELFFLARDRDRAIYQQGIGGDDRRTVGVRLIGTRGRTDIALQAAHQFGTFAGNSRIDSNGIAADVGWRAGKTKWLRLGVSAGYAQGDRNAADDTLQTFDPVYPNLGYFTDAPVLYPGNSSDIQPNITLTLPGQIRIRAGSDRIFRLTAHDAVYTAPGVPLVPGRGEGSRSVSALNSVHADWSPTPHIQVSAAWVTSDIGSLVRQSGGRNLEYEMLGVALRK
jgi:alginate export protein